MGKDKLLTTITAVLFVVGLGCIIYVLFGQVQMKQQIQEVGQTECVDNTLSKSMQEDRMAGFIDKGQAFRVLSNYYKCNPVKIGDIVWHRFSKNIEPVVRIVKAIPNDKFEIYRDNKDTKKWYVKINGEDVKFHGKRFALMSNSIPPLKTYEIQHKSIMPKDRYILLTSKSPGLSDSSNFGLIPKAAIVGKVELPSN